MNVVASRDIDALRQPNALRVERRLLREPCPLRRRQSRDRTTSPSQARRVTKAPTMLYSTTRLPTPTTILLAQLRREAAPPLRESRLLRGPASMLSTSLPSSARPCLPCKACRSFYDRACGKPSCSRCVPCAKHTCAAQPLNRREPGNCSYSRRAFSSTALANRARSAARPLYSTRETFLLDAGTACWVPRGQPRGHVPPPTLPMMRPPVSGVDHWPAPTCGGAKSPVRELC